MCIHIYNNKKTKILFSIHIDMCIHIYCNTMYTVFKNIGGTQYGSD